MEVEYKRIPCETNKWDEVVDLVKKMQEEGWEFLDRIEGIAIFRKVSKSNK